MCLGTWVSVWQLKLRKHLKEHYRACTSLKGSSNSPKGHNASGPRPAKTKGTGAPQRRRRASKVPPAHQAAAAAPEETPTASGALGHRMLHGMASAAATLVRPLWAAPPSTFEHAGTGLALRRAVSLNAMHCIHTHQSFSPDLRCSERSAGLDTSDVPHISRQTHSASVLSPAATDSVGKSEDKAPTPERKGKGRMQKRRRGGGTRGGGAAAAAAAPAAEET